ncbi:MAG: 50S ribosomal protein L1 [Myxococcales bacterium]|nr:50S ribosomal protein L1 [Myxococcales bacterium]MCB9643440.1 50S ribosomal protein L1 [Myxococcales bacterium]
MPRIPKKREGSTREKGKRIPHQRGKKSQAARELLEVGRLYALDEALELLKKPEFNFARFDQSVDVAVQLGVDPRKSDQMVRGAVVLPNGTGKTVRIAVFAKGEKAKEAEEAGADIVGGEELVEKIRTENWLDFDKAIATPDMMRHVGLIGKLLGPRGLMPSPKVGTVTFDVGNAVREQKSGKIEFRVDKAGIVHSTVGKSSFSAEQLRGNILAIFDTIMRAKPQTSKGVYLQKASISLTQSPGVTLDVASIQGALKAG